MAVNDRYVWLDLARGASAILVCAGHFRLMTMCSYRDLPDPNFFQTLFYVITGLGTQAVMVFFVLSGMLGGASVLRAGEKFRPGEYLVARTIRLWVVLIPALVFTLVVDAFTLQQAPEVAQGSYFRRWTSGPLPDGSYSASLATFLGNAAFVNTIFVPSYGTNGPLWTLACEFWYYILFPLLAHAAGWIGPRSQVGTRIGALLLAAGIAAIMPASMLGGFLVWLMGVGVAVVVPRLPAKPRVGGTMLGLLVFALSLVYSKLAHYGFVEPIPSRYIVGLGFAILCVQLVRLPSPAGWIRWDA